MSEAAASAGPAAHDAHEYCSGEARRHDHDRYLAALFAPQPARHALMALLAFNQEIARIRESVSEPALGDIRLQFWRDAVGQVFAGAPPAHPVALALAEAVVAHGLTRALVDRLIEAREADLDSAAPATLIALESYAEATSGALAELELEALGVSNDAAASAARHVGIAWALTGLVRAVPFHAAQRRLYVPSETMAACGLSEGEVFAGRYTPALGKAMAVMLEAAAHHLVEARALRAEVPRAALPALLPAVLCTLYQARLARGGHNPYRRTALSVARRVAALTLSSKRGRY